MQVRTIPSPEQERSSLLDRTARELFVCESHDGLFRWFYRLMGSPDEAADLTQDTFLAFWDSLGRRPETVSPRTWLYAIGRNLWRGRLRDRKSFEPALLALVPDSGPSPEDRFLEREFRDAVDEAVADLPDDLREAFTLRFWQEMAYEEIGQIQGVSADLARWRYFAARKRLHGRLATWNPDLKQGKEDRHAR
jgi:RNA polymerase sigma factor (sigma-70 family)